MCFAVHRGLFDSKPIGCQLVKGESAAFRLSGVVRNQAFTMNTALIHIILRRYRRSFLTFFAAFGEQDVERALHGDGAYLLQMFAERYGYGQSEAKAAWNEFVMRFVDGSELVRLEQKTTAHAAEGPAFWIPSHRRSTPVYGLPLHRGTLQ